MRVIYLHQYFITPNMAGGSRSFEMARRLVSAGHEVHLVTSDQSPKSSDEPWRETIEAGIHVHWTPVSYDNAMGYARRLLAFLAFAWRSARRAASIRADIVFATSTPLTIAIPAVYAARRLKVPMVFEVRDLWPAVPIAIGALRNPILVKAARWLERFAYKSSTHVVALAPGMREEIVRTGYPKECVTVIPNGCDLDLFADNDKGESLRHKHHWLGKRPLVVFTGTFGRVNGMDYLVRLAESCLRIDSDVRFLAIGGGAEFEPTEQLAKKLNVLERNLFLPGSMPKTEVAAWVRAANMTIALFTGPEIVWRDAVQNKFFDSLAAGTPVVNNFAGWQSKIARDAGAGLILDADDTDVAARELIEALRNDEWLQQAQAAARRLATNRFDRDRLAAELALVLEDAVRTGRCGTQH